MGFYDSVNVDFRGWSVTHVKTREHSKGDSFLIHPRESGHQTRVIVVMLSFTELSHCPKFMSFYMLLLQRLLNLSLEGTVSLFLHLLTYTGVICFSSLCKKIDNR